VPFDWYVVAGEFQMFFGFDTVEAAAEAAQRLAQAGFRQRQFTEEEGLAEAIAQEEAEGEKIKAIFRDENGYLSYTCEGDEIREAVEIYERGEEMDSPVEQYVGSDGHLMVNGETDGEVYPVRVDEIILESFVAPRPEQGMVAIHPRRPPAKLLA
jgi:hypothetical protein